MFIHLSPHTPILIYLIPSALICICFFYSQISGQHPKPAKNKNAIWKSFNSIEIGIESFHSSILYSLVSCIRISKLFPLFSLYIYMSRYKRDTITTKLKSFLTHIHKIYPSFGVPIFFEYCFRNPYPQDHCFSINFDDTELRYVVFHSISHKQST